ncbi:MAG: proteasome accessory factor PafA2 family protein, partial [Micrococcales bacterium]|nr:proteasome accessory factor PafA2 family protein [Micrococcales bacterium]
DDREDPQTEQVVGLWRNTLERLDADPWSAADTVEWVAKHAVLAGLAQRAGVGWDDPRLAAADLQWADLRPDRGIAATMTRQGRLVRVVDEETAAAAEHHPPADTRAWLRGEAIRDLGPQVFAASWNSLVFDTGAPSLVRLPMEDPQGYRRADAQAALTPGVSAAQLLNALTGHSRPPGG